MKKILVKCPICGKVDKIVEMDTYKCSYCNVVNDINDCKIIYMNYKDRNVLYLESCLRKSIEAKNDKFIKIYIEEILKKDKDNILANYFNIISVEGKKNYLCSSKIDDDLLYFIIKNDILKMKKVDVEYKKSIIDFVSDEKKKKILLQYLEENSDQDKILFDELISEKVEILEYKGKNSQKQLGIIMISLSIIASFIISLICSYTVYDDCVYGTIIAICIFPTIFLTIGIMKLIESNKLIYGLLIYIIAFYTLTYIMTIPHHDVSFLSSFKEHVNRIIYAIPDILESITNHSKVDELPKE